MEAFLILQLVPEKIFLNLDNRKYFGGCHAPGHHKRNILNFINASHSLVLLYSKNILADIYENPTTLNTLLINLSIDNPQKKKTNLEFLALKEISRFLHQV